MTTLYTCIFKFKKTVLGPPSLQGKIVSANAGTVTHRRVVASTHNPVPRLKHANHAALWGPQGPQQPLSQSPTKCNHMGQALLASVQQAHNSEPAVPPVNLCFPKDRLLG